MTIFRCKFSLEDKNIVYNEVRLYLESCGLWLTLKSFKKFNAKLSHNLKD
jgi:hypothetical protein